MLLLLFKNQAGYGHYRLNPQLGHAAALREPTFRLIDHAPLASVEGRSPGTELPALKAQAQQRADISVSLGGNVMKCPGRKFLRRSAAMSLPCLAVAALAAVLMVGDAMAQPNYPDRPVRLLAGFPAGGPSDIVARLVGDKLSEALGKTVVVEVLTGAGGSIATDRAAKAAPDGHTLLMATSGMIVVNPNLYPRLPFDPLKDLVPIIEICVQPNFLVVHNDVPANSVQDLVALARRQPGTLTFASGGVGKQPFAGELSSRWGKSTSGTGRVAACRWRCRICWPAASIWRSWSRRPHCRRCGRGGCGRSR